MQLHLHVLHTKQEMFALRRAVIGMKAWCIAQQWAEQPPPAPRIIECVTIHCFIHASDSERTDTEVLMGKALLALTEWETLCVVSEWGVECDVALGVECTFAADELGEASAED